jgi:hypothetical protein
MRSRKRIGWLEKPLSRFRSSTAKTWTRLKLLIQTQTSKETAFDAGTLEPSTNRTFSLQVEKLCATKQESRSLKKNKHGRKLKAIAHWSSIIQLHNALQPPQKAIDTTGWPYYNCTTSHLCNNGHKCS